MFEKSNKILTIAILFMMVFTFFNISNEIYANEDVIWEVGDGEKGSGTEDGIETEESYDKNDFVTLCKGYHSENEFNYTDNRIPKEFRESLKKLCELAWGKDGKPEGQESSNDVETTEEMKFFEEIREVYVKYNNYIDEKIKVSGTIRAYESNASKTTYYLEDITGKIALLDNSDNVDLYKYDDRKLPNPPRVNITGILRKGSSSIFIEVTNIEEVEIDLSGTIPIEIYKINRNKNVYIGKKVEVKGFCSKLPNNNGGFRRNSWGLMGHEKERNNSILIQSNAGNCPYDQAYVKVIGSAKYNNNRIYIQALSVSEVSKGQLAEEVKKILYPQEYQKEETPKKDDRNFIEKTIDTVGKTVSGIVSWINPFD